MLTEKQYHMVERSYHHSGLVFKVEERVFHTEDIIYHRNKTITFKDCIEINETCFEEDGTKYYGEYLNTPLLSITVKDPNRKGTKNSCWIASQYYIEDIVKVTKSR